MYSDRDDNNILWSSINIYKMPLETTPINELFRRKEDLERAYPELKKDQIPKCKNGAEVFRAYYEIREEVLNRIRNATSFNSIK